MRRLIVNADDFGLTKELNRGIIEAHRRGVVTSATLMANGPAFADAVQLAQTEPQLSVGCHVVLVDGQPALDPETISTLVDRSPGARRFRDGIGGFALRALAGRLDAREIEAEATAQIRKLQA